MSRPNSFKEGSKENIHYSNIKSLLRDKNLNPNKINDLKYLLSLTISPGIKRFNFDYLLTFLLKYRNSQNEKIFYEYFFQACELSKLSIVNILLENDIDMNCQNELGETPLHIAIAKNDIELIKLLVKFEPKTNITTYKDMLTPLNYAEICGNKIIIKIIKELDEKNKKKSIKNEIFNFINNDFDNLNNNLNNYLIKDTSSFISRNNSNMNKIQNYNGEIISLMTDEDMSSSILTNNINKQIPSAKSLNNSENKYLNTQTIVNESDYYEISPINKNVFSFHNNNSSNKNNIKNYKKIPNDVKLFSSSFRKKDEVANHYNNLSINPSYIQSLTTCHTLNKDHLESPLAIHKYSKSISKKTKENLIKFIEEINLPKDYANNLLDNGFDILEVLVSQSKKGIALSYQNLKDIGINRPGDRAKILVHLEEISGNFNFYIDKETIYSNKIINNKNNSLYRFLSGIKYEHYINKFYEGGYCNSELLFVQMASKQPLNEQILIEDLGINKFDAVKIIENLKNDSDNYIQDIKRNFKNNEKNGNKSIIFEENNNTKSCDMCLIF